MEQAFSEFVIPKNSRFLDILELARIWNSFLPALLVFVGFFILSQNVLFTLPLVLLALCFALLYMGAAIVNDIYDYKVDIINMPFRPLQTKRITVSEAKILAVIFYSSALALALFLNLKIFLIVGLAVFLSILYSARPLFLKDRSVLGTIKLGVLTVFFPVYAGSVFLLDSFNVPDQTLIFFILLTVLFIFIAFLKDLKDIYGDRAHAKRTLATALNGKKTLIISIVGVIIFFPLTTYYVSKFFSFNLFFYVINGLLLLFLIKTLIKTYNKDQYYAATTFSKARIVMLVYVLDLLGFSLIY